MKKRTTRGVAALVVVGCGSIPVATLASGSAALGEPRVAQVHAHAPHEVYPVPPSGTYSFHGRGFGHGHGMSQWGAYGAAKVDHLSANQILHFYYPHTTLATRTTTRNIRVLITAASAPSRGYLKVAPAAGLSVAPAGGGKPAMLATKTQKGHLIDAWRLNKDGASVDVQEHANSHWHTTSTVTGGAAFTDTAGKVRVDLPGRTVRYRGTMIGEIESGSLEAVNEVSLELYLRGVVPSEMSSSWSPAALQAQAVAARTYASRGIRSPKAAWFDVYGDTRDQAYGGMAAEAKTTTKALKATAGEIVVDHHRHPILAQYASADGGWTVSGGVAYLPSKQDPYDGAVPNSAHAWVTSVSAGSLQSAYPQVGKLQSIVITGRDGDGLWGGRVSTLKLRGSSGTAAVTGTDLQFALGLRSPWFRPVPVPGAPGNLKATFAKQTLTATWHAPKSISGAAKPTAYRVTVSPGHHHVTVSGTTRTASISGLSPKTYSVSVFARSASGPGPAASATVSAS